MRSIQTSLTFPLASVKPLDGLLGYRRHCLAETRKALQDSRRRRTTCPVDGQLLQSYGEVEGFEYVRCQGCGSLFLAEVAEPRRWNRLLTDVSSYRDSPKAFHADLARSRTDHVYAPKLEWIQEALRLQQVERPKLLEVTTPPSGFTQLLKDAGFCSEIIAGDEMQLRMVSRDEAKGTVHVALLLESLDRVDDPVALLRGVSARLVDGGLLFVTGLVCSGFDMAVLGLKNLYLCPPDRTNCFSLQGLSALITQAGFTLQEISTPGVLDIEIVQAHLCHDPLLQLSPFERQLMEAGRETHTAFQAFLQQQGYSSFARLVGRKTS